MNEVNIARGELHLRTFGKCVADTGPEILIGRFNDNLRIDKGVHGKFGRNEVCIGRAVFLIKYRNTGNGRTIGSKRWKREIWLVQDGCNFFALINGTTATHQKEHIGSTNVLTLSNGAGICMCGVGSVDNPAIDNDIGAEKCVKQSLFALLHSGLTADDNGM